MDCGKCNSSDHRSGSFQARVVDIDEKVIYSKEKIKKEVNALGRS